MYEIVFAILAVVIVCYFFFLPDAPPLCGVYCQPGKFYLLKYITFRVIVWLGRIRQKRDGKKSKLSANETERLQDLPESSPLAIDAIYFNGSDKRGNYVMAACARRQCNVSQTVFIVRLSEFGLLELSTLPDTNWKRTDEDAKGVYGAGGLVIEPVEPMKRWRIHFEGKLKLNGDNARLVEAEADLEWTARSDYFQLDTGASAHALASSIAREPWSRGFFERLRDAYQTQYEQFGDLQGTMSIYGGKSPRGQLQYALNLRGVREHSYGLFCDWSSFHRCAMQFVHTADNLCFNASVCSTPNTLSRLEFGYVVEPDGKIVALRSVLLPLHNLGETTEAPFNYEFQTVDERGRRYRVECEVLERPMFYLGENSRREVKILEQMCRYKVNGVQGWGFSRWQYRHLEYKEDKRDC